MRLQEYDLMSYEEWDLRNFCINLNSTEAACQYCFLFIQNISFLKTCLLLTSTLSSPLQTFAVSSQFQDAKLRDIILFLYSRFSSLLQRLSFDEFSLSVYGYGFKQFCGYFVFALLKKNQVKSLAVIFSSALPKQLSLISASTEHPSFCWYQLMLDIGKHQSELFWSTLSH